MYLISARTRMQCSLAAKTPLQNIRKCRCTFNFSRMRHEWLKYSPSEALLLTSWDCEINAMYYDTRNVSFSLEFVIAAGDAIASTFYAA